MVMGIDYPFSRENRAYDPLWYLLMAVGLKVKNVNGFLVVDGTYSNLSLRSFGSFDMSNAEQMTNGAYFKAFQLLGNNPVVALGGASLALVLNSSLSGGVLTVVITSPNRSAIPYYLYDDADKGLRLNNNYALLVRNTTTGQVVFDSRCRYMKIIDVITGNDANFTAITRDYSAFTSSVAVVQSVRWRYGTTVFLPGTPPKLQPFSTCSASKVEGAVVTIDSIMLWTFAPDAQNPTFNDANTLYTYLVLDAS